MEARIEVDVEHLGGPAKVVVAVELEPNSEAWNEALALTVAQVMNQFLTAMIDERNRIRFEEERESLVPADERAT
jgi:hypothetical protein